MKKHAPGFSLLCLAFLLSMAASAVAQQAADNPVVLKAAAPKAYPPIAKSARAAGKVTVKVTINAAGQVTADSFISGHPLLKAGSLEAARRWLFAAVEKGERSATLEFVYSIADKEEEAGLFFAPPYRVEIVAPPQAIH